MMKLRPYSKEDAKTILSWSADERAFYKWCAGVIGDYPATEKEFAFVENLIAFTAYDESGIVGFFTMRQPDLSKNILRAGFVIVDPMKRGQGLGKKMLSLALKYAFEEYKADEVSLGVFENNEPAYYCYKAAGFEEVILDEVESYKVLGEEWKCIEMRIRNPYK